MHLNTKYIPTVFLNHLHMDNYCTKTNLGIKAMTNSPLESDNDESVCWNINRKQCTILNKITFLKLSKKDKWLSLNSVPVPSGVWIYHLKRTPFLKGLPEAAFKANS